MDVIEKKVEAGGEEIEGKPKRTPRPTKMIDLVSVLQKSLEQTGGAKMRKTVPRNISTPAGKRRDSPYRESGVDVNNVSIYDQTLQCRASIRH
jgi:hypothetical protein